MSLIFDQYSDRLRRKRKSTHTLSGFGTAAERLDRWLAAQGLSAETASFETLEEYFDTLPLAPSSRGTHLRHIQAAYNYAVKRGTLRHNPALDIEIERPPDTEPTIIPAEELRAIRDRIWLDRDWVFFHLLAYTGLRRSEIASLRWEDVLLGEETLRVLGKGGKRRIVPIHPALGEVLVADKRRTPFVVLSNGERGVSCDTVQRIQNRLHPEYTCHAYRRTVTSSLRYNGVDVAVIDRILGWAPRSVRDRYYVNVADAELKRAILRLYADAPL